MQEQQFLLRLQKTAHDQSLFPSSHNRFTAFFWHYAWQCWFFAALITAFIYELWQGRCHL